MQHGWVFVGVVWYCDDILLLTPSREATQKMLQTCELFTVENNIKDSTHQHAKKSKTLYIVGPGGGAGEAAAPVAVWAPPALGGKGGAPRHALHHMVRLMPK